MTFINARAYEAENETIYEPKILDSGKRTTFPTGSVRDIQEGKGRCDLLPLDSVCEVANIMFEEGEKIYNILYNINGFVQTGDWIHLAMAVSDFIETDRDAASAFADMVLDLSIHFEQGAKKYEPNNWKLGIPLSRYVDSGTRHILKYFRGDKDEAHGRAFVWNMVCGIWTCQNKPELNEYGREKEA